MTQQVNISQGQTPERGCAFDSGGRGTEQVDALSKAVLSIDGARRVGWAKAFSAIRQLETVSSDFNIVDTDRKLYREKFSYLWGVYREYMDLLAAPGSVALKEVMLKLGAADLTLLESSGIVEPNQVWDGRMFARALIDKVANFVADGSQSPDEFMQALAHRRMMQRNKKRRKGGKTVSDESLIPENREKLYAAAKQEVWREIAEEHGYDSVARFKKEIRLFLKSRKSKDESDLLFAAAKRKAVEEILGELGVDNVEDLASALRNKRDSSSEDGVR